MTAQLSENEFLARIREDSARERSMRKSVARRPKYLKKFSLVLAWLLVIVGIIVGALFMFAMESAHDSFAPLAESGIVSVVNDEGFSEYFKQIALDWLPLFFKVYAIRYLILLIEVGLFGGLATVFFLLARTKKESDSQ